MNARHMMGISDSDPTSPFLRRLQARLLSYRFLARPFAIVFCIYLVGISAILRSNFYYLDDQGRTFEGFRQWGDVFSRYTADFLSQGVFADSYLTDISPLTQLIAVAEMAVAGVLLAYLVGGKQRFSAWTYVALVPFALSPYYLECFTYKFDAPFMALSVLASLVPLAFSRAKPLTYCCIVFAGTLVMCTTYQASSGILPMVTLFVAYERWHRQEGSQWRFIGKTALAYSAGILVFFLFLMKPLPADSYVTIDAAPSSSLLVRTATNYAHFFEKFLSEWKGLWLGLLLLMIGLFIIMTIVLAQDHVGLVALFSVAVVLCLFLLAFGLYPLLAKPILEPRSMYGLGVIVSLMALDVCAAPRWYGAKLVCGVLSWCFFVFAFTYGNALQLQNHWIEFRTQQAISDISSLELQSPEGPKDLLVVGDAGFSPAFDNMDEEDFAMIKSLIRQSFGGFWWYVYGFKYYYRLEQLGQIHVITSPTNESYGEFNDLPLLKTTVYNRIYGNDTHLKLEIV